jgi:hypothetical protein
MLESEFRRSTFSWIGSKSAGSPIIDDSRITNPTLHEIVPKIATGIYIKDHLTK